MKLVECKKSALEEEKNLNERRVALPVIWHGTMTLETVTVGQQVVIFRCNGKYRRDFF